VGCGLCVGFVIFSVFCCGVVSYCLCGICSGPFFLFFGLGVPLVLGIFFCWFYWLVSCFFGPVFVFGLFWFVCLSFFLFFGLSVFCFFVFGFFFLFWLLFWRPFVLGWCVVWFFFGFLFFFVGFFFLFVVFLRTVKRRAAARMDRAPIHNMRSSSQARRLPKHAMLVRKEGPLFTGTVMEQPREKLRPWGRVHSP